MKKILFAFLFITTPIFSQTIQEKKESFHKSVSGIDAKTEEELIEVNELLNEKRFYLKSLFNKVSELYFADAEEELYKRLLAEIQTVKSEIVDIEEMWRDRNGLSKPLENYSLWDQPDTSLAQLIMDYSKGDFLYLIPPEVGAMRISISSNLPVPREAWNECLNLILAQNGVGIKDLSPYVRELYFFRNDLAHIKHITADFEDLAVFDGKERICFVLTPESSDPGRAFHFLQKFSNPVTTVIELVRNDIYIISTNDSIQELLKLYEFFTSGKRNEEYQLVTLTKVEAITMLNILESAFYGADRKGRDDLRIIAIQDSHSLFLFGTKEEVSKATSLIRDVESQIEDPREKTLFWYTAKHSDAEELATLLAKVYDLLVGGCGSFANEGERIDAIVAQERENPENLVVTTPIHNPVHSPELRVSHKTADGQNNFIVDQKTGSIIMVVEQDALVKIKELLKKLDVPKKMVQIEVLLFEKKVTNQNQFGLNLLRIGSSASNTNKEGATWNGSASGIFEFLISHAKGASGIPAFDLAYKFLLGQEDVQINASPSVLTVNQTPATIAIVEEISINTGSESVDKKTKNLYSRAQYGITLQITPTINLGDEEDDVGFITLDTDITFDTTTKKNNDRPDVTRRHIKNHVRIADGQTVILGGLRRKTTDDNKESIPFLGEIPGLGKLFSVTDLNDSSTEMFLFITPKIIYDPQEDLERIKKEELCKRPGDIPEFLSELATARSREKKRLCEGALTALFGRAESTSKSTKKDYDGR